MRSLWTAEMIAQLRCMAAEGRRANEAGQALGVSRSAALGKAFRNGIKFGEGRPPAPKRPAAGPRGPRIVSLPKPRARSVAPQPVDPMKTKKPAPTVERSAPVVVTAPVRPVDPIGLFDLKDRHCRFPLWGKQIPADVSTAMFCGAPTANEKCSWCPVHLAVVSAPPRGSLSGSRMKQAAERAA